MGTGSGRAAPAASADEGVVLAELSGADITDGMAFPQLLQKCASGVFAVPQDAQNFTISVAPNP
jgi:hypothetical protein